MSDDLKKKFKELARVLYTAPIGSARYKKAQKELDAIIGPEELSPEGDESYDEQDREPEAD